MALIIVLMYLQTIWKIKILVNTWTRSSMTVVVWANGRCGLDDTRIYNSVCRMKIIENLRHIPSAPSVQTQGMFVLFWTRSWIVTHAVLKSRGSWRWILI